ncbi:MAG: GIY-YIG nuclease family protein [Eubacteriales bacterium]|nr:GIY-YIG nuclease family protein [Eubacteriales bacterium]
MDSNSQKLKEIFEDDPYDLLEIKPKITQAKSEDSRLIDSFNEIMDFYYQYNREPDLGADISERTLYYRLKAIRENKEKTNLLLKYDSYNLLDEAVEDDVKSIDEIFSNDYFGILNCEADDVFELKHVPKETTMPEYVASRKKCTDFEKYEPLLKECQLDIKSGKRRLKPFKNEQQIEKGYFFILKGVLLYIADIGERESIKGKINARLRCIFENGTESDMLLRSLSAELYKNGRRVTEHSDRLLDNFYNITDEDRESGYIYILKTKSDRPEIKVIENLYKIGYSRIPVEERVKNAEQEPTYLMAPVSIISVYKCYNMNPQKFEQLLHNFFGNSCLNIDIYDRNGLRHTPREWFVADLSIIEEAIQLIISGKIVAYKYDSLQQIIIEK